jgi:sugar O-acyltransferase (sialic acid O-acetyltransferase NeuD family)
MREVIPKIVIYGAGGFGREIAWLIEEINRNHKTFEIVGFIDDDISLAKSTLNNYPVLGGMGYFNENDDVAVAIGIANPIKRYQVVEKLKAFQLDFPNLVHPSVAMGKQVELGKGNIICANAIITVNIRVGNFCHLNLKTTIGHDSVVENYVTTACGVDFAGNSHICNCTYFGNHATVLPYVRVAPFAVLGAGAVANKDVTEGSVYVGVPAKRIKSNPRYEQSKLLAQDSCREEVPSFKSANKADKIHSRFGKWEFPEMEEGKPNKYNWIVQCLENFHLGYKTDIGAYTYINARRGVVIEDYVQIGSHCSIYSDSTIDNKKGKIVFKKNSRVGSHSVVMPGVTIGENSIVGAQSYVNKSIPDNVTAFGVPAKVIKS